MKALQTLLIILFLVSLTSCNQVVLQDKLFPEPLEVTHIPDNEPKPEAQPQAEVIKELKTKCWFAVSGTWIGYGGYDDVFGQTFSGNPIGPGEQFDNVGGVYLEARDEPYIYGEGGGEIDRAYNTTFDSIMVAPGMHAEIRDGAGNLLFDGDGPLIAESKHYADQAQWAGNYYNTFKAINDPFRPQWVSNYMITHDRFVAVPLQTAKWVKISVKLESDCGALAW